MIFTLKGRGRHFLKARHQNQIVEEIGIFEEKLSQN